MNKSLQTSRPETHLLICEVLASPRGLYCFYHISFFSEEKKKKKTITNYPLPSPHTPTGSFNNLSEAASVQHLFHNCPIKQQV